MQSFKLTLRENKISPLYKITHPEQKRMYNEILTFDGGVISYTKNDLSVQKPDGTVFRTSLRHYETDFITETYIGILNGNEFRFLFASESNPMASVDPMVTFGSVSTSGWAIHFNIEKVEDSVLDCNSEKDEFCIIDIEENTIPAFGKVLIVKANPLDKNPFKDIEILRKSNRFSYCMNECAETKIFIFKFDENLAQELVEQAHRSNRNEDFWAPSLDDFTPVDIRFGEQVKSCLRHSDLGKDKAQSFKAQPQNSITKVDCSTGKEEKVKGQQLSDGYIYTGQALMTTGNCIPNGPGLKRKESNMLKIQGWFDHGKLVSPGLIMYEKYMTLGLVEELKPNGWTFEMCRGSFNFAYYAQGEIVKDVTPLIHGFYNCIREDVKFKITHNSTFGYFVALGTLPQEDRPFSGFVFVENGDVYVGHGTKNDSYEITGRYMHFSNIGDLKIGEFQNGKLKRGITSEEFTSQYLTNCPNVIYIDAGKNLFKEVDSKLYMVLRAKQTYDFDVNGVVFIVTALPINRAEINGSQLHFDQNACETFYFDAKDDIEDSISRGAKVEKLWKITPQDYHWMEASVYDEDSQRTEERNVRVHNSLKGLPYEDVDQFTCMPMSEYIRFNSFEPESKILEDVFSTSSDDDDDLPF